MSFDPPEHLSSAVRGMAEYRTPSEVRVQSALSRRIEIADSVSLATVLREEFDISIPEDITSSWKMVCPFAPEHAATGVERTARAYADGGLYCFASLDHGRMGPVALIQRNREWGLPRTLDYIEEHFGLARREHYTDRMTRMLADRVRAQHRNFGDPADAVAALQAEARNVQGYLDVQYDSVVLEAFQSQVEALREAMDGSETLLGWFAAASAALRSVIQARYEQQQDEGAER